MAKGRLLSYQILAVAFTLSVTLILYFSPRTVTSSQYSTLSPQQARVMLALSYVGDKRQPPMKGILMMRDIADADPLNSAAVFYTAEFSMTSGQYDKAEKRYRQLLRTTSGPQQLQAAQGLANCLIAMGDTTEARVILKQYFENSSDSLLLQSPN
ncbi:MAG: tetratricopeptide repeat protein [Bacteroidota bacterium]